MAVGGLTCRAFLVTFLLPQLVLVAAVIVARFMRSSPSVRREPRRGIWLIVTLAVVAVVTTAPWDRWLIQHEVWGYPPGSELGTVALVPIEEYFFMVAQTLLTGCWMLFVTTHDVPRVPAPAAQRWRRPLHAVVWLLVADGGLLIATQPRTPYLGALFTCFASLLALQTAAGADVAQAARAGRLAGLALTPLLWAADAVAIHNGTRRISDEHTVGVGVLGLPVEEAVFLLTTNLLVVNSVALISAPLMRKWLSSWLRPGARRVQGLA